PAIERYQTFAITETSDERARQFEWRHGAAVHRQEARADAEQFSLLLAPAHYTMRVEMRDLSSRHAIDTMVQVIVRRYDTSAPVLSDLMVYRHRTGNRIAPA